MVFKKATSYFTAIVLLLIIIVTVIIVSIKQTDDLKTINNEITTSFEITELADRILTLSIDNETGARGYLLTGNDNFLAPFENAKLNLSIALDSLKNIKEIRQQYIIDSIIVYAEKRFSFSKKMIEIRQNNNLEQSIKKYNADDGRIFMEKIRYFISILKYQQNQLLNEAKLKSNDSFNQLAIIQYLIVGSALILIIVLGYKFRSDALKTKTELERKVKEQTLQIRSILESISDSFIAIDKNFTITYINKTSAIYFQQDPEILIHENLKKILPKEKNQELYLLIENGMASNKKVQGEVWDGDTRNWLHHYIYPSENLVTIYTRNINDEKKREKEMEVINEDLRRLSTHLQQIREEERKTIARDLHDDLGQQLTGLQMDIHWMQKKLQEANPLLLNKINEMNEMVNNTIRSIRRILSDLRPAILDDLGMLAAMEWLNQETSKRYPIHIHFQVNTQEIPLSSDVASGLFRIYQEAINNAIKHANAKNISTVIEVTDTPLTMAITVDAR
ncbi:MAG: CHASE3 domain-containing protein [Chitinophagaceae bacterium]|nr:CHASE3 domain-containing protein [Chitinophagaceae bacterium]